MCHLITDPSVDVQKMAYAMLKTAAEQRTEYLVIEVGVGNIGADPIPEEVVEAEAAAAAAAQAESSSKPKKKKKEAVKKDDRPQLLPIELIQILQRDVRLTLGGLEDVEEVVYGVFGWMLGWMLLFDSFKNAV
jgi:hypothetical protein